MYPESSFLLHNKRSCFLSDKGYRLQLILTFGSILVLFVLIVSIFSWQLGVQIKEKNANNNNVPQFASLKGFCAHIQGINQTEYETRRNNLAQELTSVGLNAILIEPGADLTYFTGISWGLSERPFLFVMLANGSYSFVCPAFEQYTARNKVGSGAILYLWQENESPYVTAGAALSISAFPNGAMNVAVGYEMRNFLIDGLKAAWVNMTIQSGKSVTGPLRIIKTQHELEILECANLATKAALQAVMPLAKVGMSEGEVYALITSAQTTAGLTNTWGLVLSGPNAAYPHGTSNARNLQEGDLLLMDVGGSLYGYNSDITRTFKIGSVPLNANQTNAYQTVKRAQLAALSVIKPGIPCSTADDAARNVIIDAGYGPGFTYFTHRLGHGIGLQGHEDPYLVKGNNNTLFAPGMVFSIEPGIYVQGQFGIRLEDIAYVTENGVTVFGGLAESP